MTCKSQYVDKLSELKLQSSAAHSYFDLAKIDKRYGSLPYSIRVLLESAVRNCDGFHILQSDVANILDWEKQQNESCEIPYRPARVLLQDFTGVPAVVDFAAMRDAVKALGGNPQIINPVCPADLVIDHSVQVDKYGDLQALAHNQEREFERNRERFLFLKWGAQALSNTLIVPPGSGIVHQVNLEYLARVVFSASTEHSTNQLCYPDSVVGTDSHTTMIGGLGVLGWGVGGIEAEAVMLGQPISMVLPQVVGYKLIGHMPPQATSTDLVLTVTKNLRDLGVVGKFVEFYGSGVFNLSIADRASIANMCPEYGATVGFFPVDKRTIAYLQQTGRDNDQVERIEAYLRAAGLFVDYNQESSNVKYTQVLELDLSTILPSLAGPKRPQDLVSVANIRHEFALGLTQKVSFKSFGLAPEKGSIKVPVTINGTEYMMGHGSVVIGAITSCTNTSNPSVMLAAGLVCKKAHELGLKVPEYVKTSLSPGSGVVTKYLNAAGLMPFLEKMGFHVVGYGCMTCIGNSGPLLAPIADAIEKNDLVVAGVLSGNRNFEGRIHPHVRANYLASPPLVVMYALAGRIDIDWDNEPIGVGTNGQSVYFRDIWPTHQEVSALEETCVLPEFFREVYKNIKLGSSQWQALQAPETELYPWDTKSTYIKLPPFFHNMTKTPSELKSVVGARVLLNLGDSVTTDHISPAGAIARNSPAAKWLNEQGVESAHFNTYGARRGHDQVMARGTFANIRIVNKFLDKPGPNTKVWPSGEQMSVFDAAAHYQQKGEPVIILAGKEYGSGSSRDWAAKGPYLQGVRCVLAESYERIHRSNLVGMGIVPLQYTQGQSATTCALTGKETYSIPLGGLKPRQMIDVKLDDGRTISVICRIDTEVELAYVQHGGILQYMVRKLAFK